MAKMGLYSGSILAIPVAISVAKMLRENMEDSSSSEPVNEPLRLAINARARLANFSGALPGKRKRRYG